MTDTDRQQLLAAARALYPTDADLAAALDVHTNTISRCHLRPDSRVTSDLTAVSPNLLIDLLIDLLRERERVLRADPSRTSRPARPTPLSQSR